MSGYLYQIRYGLVLAVNEARSGRSVKISIEALDDVAFEPDGTPTELFQLKHHLNQAASLSDMSPDLWEALRVWMQEAGTEDLLHLVTTSVAPDASAAAFLRPGPHDTVEADARLEAACHASTNTALRSTMDDYVALSRSDRLQLLERVTVLDSQEPAADIGDTLRDAVRWATSAPLADAFVNRLEGWWLERCVSQLAGGDRIGTDEVANKIDELREQLRDDNLPIDDVDALIEEFFPEGATAHIDRTFVLQLRLIDVGERRLLLAIRDWMRASAQRSRWTREQLITPRELQRYERRLVEEWEQHYAAMADELGSTAAAARLKAAGKRLYALACQSMNIRPRDRCDEGFVLRGSYHILADDTRVGWHRDFEDLLTQISSGAAS
jgi:hypothetical protein